MRGLARLVFVVALLVPGCGKDVAPAPIVTALPPVPAPAGLVAEIFIPKPNVTWGRSRSLTGGPAKLLPATYGMMVAMLFNMNAMAAELVDNDVPTVGAVVSDGTTELPVFAIHVRDGAKLKAALTQGPDATFLPREDAPSQITLLEPKPGQSALNASLGIIGNYLLVGYAPDGILKVGPYAARTVSTHPMPDDDITVIATHEALAGPLRSRLSVWWGSARRELERADTAEREKHGGSAPTFGDPKAAIAKADGAFQSLFTLMTDLSEARLSLKLDDAGAHGIALLRPRSKDGPASAELAALTTGDVEPLLDLPEDTTMAILTRDSAEMRAKNATEQLDAVSQLFSGKLPEADKQRVNELLSLWAKGRGDWLVAGATVTGEKRALYGRAAAADEAMLEKGLRAFLALPDVPAFHDPLKHWLGEVKVSPPSGNPDGGSIVKIERRPPALKIGGKERKREAERFEVGWNLEKGTGAFVVASSAKEAMRDLAKAKGAGLRGDPEVRRSLEALGKDSAFTILVLPMRALAGMTLPKMPLVKPAAAPVVVAFGKSADGGLLRFDAATEAVRELAKLRGN